MESRGTKITLSFDENFPWAEKQYITDLFNYIYPLLVAFAGEPYRSGDMRVVYRPNEHTSLTPDISELHIGNLPNIRFGNDPGFNSVFLVETFHFFIKGTTEMPNGSLLRMLQLITNITIRLTNLFTKTTCYWT